MLPMILVEDEEADTNIVTTLISSAYFTYQDIVHNIGPFPFSR